MTKPAPHATITMSLRSPMKKERTEKQMQERATEDEWFGISDDILKKMVQEGEIKVPAEVKKRLGLP